MIYLILDMDGVLVEYRHEGKVYLTHKELHAPNQFLNRKPVPHIIDILKELRKTNQYSFHILSVSYTDAISSQKKRWARREVSFIDSKNIHLVRKKEDKGEYLELLYLALKDDHKLLFGEELRKDQIILVDDTHSILYDVEKRGFGAWHPTTLLNRGYHQIHKQNNVKNVM